MGKAVVEMFFEYDGDHIVSSCHVTIGKASGSLALLEINGVLTDHHTYEEIEITDVKLIQKIGEWARSHGY